MLCHARATPKYEFFDTFQTDGRYKVLPVVQSGHNRMNVYMNIQIEANIVTGSLNQLLGCGPGMPNTSIAIVKQSGDMHYIVSDG